MNDVVFGDLGCAGIDVDDWEKKNRAPLFPQKTQRWVLVRTDRDNPSNEDIEQTLKAALGKWFDASLFDPLDPRGVRGLVDSLKIERISRGERLNILDRIKRRDDLPEPPTIEANVPIWISASFAFRGSKRDMPWPVRKGAKFQFLSSAARCPVSADWMLDQVGEASTEDATPLPPLSEALPNAAADVVQAGVRTLALPVFIAAGLLGLIIWAKR